MRKQLLLATMMLALAPVAAAQGRGGGGQSQGGPPATQGQGQTQTQRGQAETQQRDRLHTMATDQQRDQFRTCDQSMDQIRTQARDMARAAEDQGFNVARARQQHEQIRQHVHEMVQEHERLIQSLEGEQHAVVQQRAREMNEIHTRINSRLEQMNQELAKPSPNGKRIAEHARAIEREMNEWREQHRRVGDDLGLR